MGRLDGNNREHAIDDGEIALLHRYWQAANYLSVGQIYLLDNPLLRGPLKPEHVKPRLLGHWGTTPGLNFIYAHLNRLIQMHDLDMIYVCGPGHGGPGMVANTYLEGSYSEIYPEISSDLDGVRKLFRQFSFPGGIPSHAAPETPGSIHEGGELGYALVHAYGAAFDNPDLVVACVIGDGEAETGTLAASWHSNKFLNPAHDGAVLSIDDAANEAVYGNDTTPRMIFEGRAHGQPSSAVVDFRDRLEEASSIARTARSNASADARARGTAAPAPAAHPVTQPATQPAPAATTAPIQAPQSGPAQAKPGQFETVESPVKAEPLP